MAASGRLEDAAQTASSPGHGDQRKVARVRATSKQQMSRTPKLQTSSNPSIDHNCAGPRDSAHSSSRTGAQ